MDFIHGAGIAQCILLAVYFLHKRKEPGNLLESVLLLIVAATIGISYLYATGLVLKWPHLGRFGFTFMSLIGPLFALSMKARESRGIQKWDSLWFIVPLGVTVYLIPFHLSSVDEKMRYLREDLVEIHLDCVIILYLALFNNLFSMGHSMLSMYRWEKTSSNFSNIGISMGARAYYWIPISFLLIAASYSAFDPNVLNSGLFSAAGSLIVLLRAYVLLYNRETSGENHAMYPPELRYRKNLLPEDLVQQKGQTISEYLDEESPFLEPDFQLPQLAKAVNLNTVQASQIINRYFKCSFIQLIQKRRVEHAVDLLRQRDESFSILDIAMESGFNSKSSFNASFRRIHGQSPSEYRRSKQNDMTDSGRPVRGTLE